MVVRQTDRETERQTGRQTHRQVGRQTVYKASPYLVQAQNGLASHQLQQQLRHWQMHPEASMV